jgi:hypothetical protein
MPPDPYFRMQRLWLPSINIAPPCEEEHGCCCECDHGGSDLEYVQPEGPVEPVQLGPWHESSAHSLNALFKQAYAKHDLVNALVPE